MPSIYVYTKLPTLYIHTKLPTLYTHTKFVPSPAGAGLAPWTRGWFHACACTMCMLYGLMIHYVYPVIEVLHNALPL